MLSSPFCKNISLLIFSKSLYIPRRLVPQRGGSRSSRNAGRDAVDADALQDGQRRRGRRSRVVPTPRRWCQIGGKLSRRRRWQTSPVTGESTKETVKTIARGMPGQTGVTVVTMLVCFFIVAYEAAGALDARHSLRPLISEAKESSSKPRARRAAGMRRCLSTSRPRSVVMPGLAGHPRLSFL